VARQLQLMSKNENGRGSLEEKHVDLNCKILSPSMVWNLLYIFVHILFEVGGAMDED
jgi:hypothetical protein